LNALPLSGGRKLPPHVPENGGGRDAVLGGKIAGDDSPFFTGGNSTVNLSPKLSPLE
jgi:hypothetical protein